MSEGGAPNSELIEGEVIEYPEDEVALLERHIDNLDFTGDKETDYPEINKQTGLRFRYIVPGKRLYESGAIYDEARGATGKGGLIRPARHTLITVDNAEDMRRRRPERQRERAVEGMRRAIETNRGVTAGVENVAEYWGEAVMSIALEHGSKNQVAALRLAAEGPLELLGKHSEGELPPGSVRLSLTGSVADLRKALTRARDGGGEGEETP